MPTIDEIFPEHASSNGGRAVRGRQGYLPQERASYGAKRRQMDLDLIYDNWNTLPQDALDSTVNISNVPKKLQKRYNRALKVHGDRLARADAEWMRLNAPHYSNQKEHALNMLEDMQKHLPNHGAKMISELPLDSFRSSETPWESAEVKGLTIFRYWNHYRMANVLYTEHKSASSLRYINKGLSLFPPLKRGELPHKGEVLGRLYRYFAFADGGEEEQAHTECRVILAAVRLLHFEKRLDMYDPEDILVEKLDVLTHQFIKRAVNLKMKEEGASRPYFSRDERLGLMKELGIGLYSAGRYRCSTCGKTKSERIGGGGSAKELSLCSGCAEVWYCSVECSKRGWKSGHKQQCGSLPAELPIKLSPTGYMRILGETMTGISVIDSKGAGGDYVLALAQEGDVLKGGIVYDVLSDKEIPIEEDENGDSGRSMEEMFGGLGIGGGLFGGGLFGGLAGGGSSDLSTVERMTQATAAADANSGMSAKELHDMRAACGDWCYGLSQVPYTKKWPDDF